MDIKYTTGWQTAIKRIKLSNPIKWLISHKYLSHDNIDIKILDYGSGRGQDAKILAIDQYDPYWYPIELQQTFYDIILCTYVLNVLALDEREKTIDKIMNYIKPHGIVYFSVRRDIKKPKPGKNCTQWPVYLDFPILYENRSFCIYEARKDVTH